MKTCPKCKETKTFDEFSKNKRQKLGLSCWCKTCDNSRKPKAPNVATGSRGLRGPEGAAPKRIVDNQQQCSRCKVWKNTDQFSKSKKAVLGLSYRCKQCDHELYIEYVTKPGKKEKRRRSS